MFRTSWNVLSSQYKSTLCSSLKRLSEKIKSHRQNEMKLFSVQITVAEMFNLKRENTVDDQFVYTDNVLNC